MVSQLVIMLRSFCTCSAFPAGLESCAPRYDLLEILSQVSTMLAALVPHPLPARGMMQYSCSASGPSVHRPGYRQVMSTTYRPVAAGAGPWIQGPSSEIFDMDREVARMQQSFQQMERQAGLCNPPIKFCVYSSGSL
jgi:hypothetical protein